MSRPRKINSEDMIRVVNSFFENDGNPSNLKYTKLEEYALTLGMSIKAYDFRRDQKVKQHIEELRQSIAVKGVGAVAYKSMDIDAMLHRNRTRDKLRSCLHEINESWQRVYENAAQITKTNNELLSENSLQKQEIKQLITDKNELADNAENLKVYINKLTAENRYLKSMLKKYLYPAVANEILKKENILVKADTEVTQAAMDKMTDLKAPSSFSCMVESDRKDISETEVLLKRLHEKISEES